MKTKALSWLMAAIGVGTLVLSVTLGVLVAREVEEKGLKGIITEIWEGAQEGEQR